MAISARCASCAMPMTAVNLRAGSWALAVLTAITLLAAVPALADSPLYETGPAQDSSFVRFLNTTGGEIAIVAARGGYRLVLPAEGVARVSKFHPAIAGRKLVASVQAGGRKLPVEVVAKPGEYVTVAVLAAGKGAPDIRLIRETPSDYSASRASISLANADPACAEASLSGGAQDVAIFEAVKPFDTRRRLVNPVKVSARLACAGRPEPQALDFGQLQPGERYSAFVIPAAGGRAAFVVRDQTL